MAVDFEFKTVSDFNSGVYNNMITAGEYLKAPYADILANELDGTPTLRHWFTSAVYYDYWWLEVFQDVGKNAVVAQTFTNNALTPWSSINYIRKVRVWPSYISYGGGIPKMRCHLYTTLNYYGQIVPDQKIMSSDPVSVPIGTTVLEFDFNERLFLQNIPTNIYALVFEWYEAGWARCRFNSYLSGTSYPYGGSLHTSIGDFWKLNSMYIMKMLQRRTIFPMFSFSTLRPLQYWQLIQLQLLQNPKFWFHLIFRRV